MKAEDLGGGASASFPLLKQMDTPQLPSAQQRRQQQQRQQQEGEVQEVYPDVRGRGGALGAPLGGFASRGPPPASGPQGAPGAGGGPLGDALEELLRDMDAKFSSLSSSILGKLDAMALKLDGLEQQLTSLLAEEQGGGPLGAPLPGSALLGGHPKAASEDS
ncbi:hypothetical protein Esti_003874 [Eimeria stiedai]